MESARFFKARSSAFVHQQGRGDLNLPCQRLQHQPELVARIGQLQVLRLNLQVLLQSHSQLIYKTGGQQVISADIGAAFTLNALLLPMRNLAQHNSNHPPPFRRAKAPNTRPPKG